MSLWWRNGFRVWQAEACLLVGYIMDVEWLPFAERRRNKAQLSMCDFKERSRLRESCRHLWGLQWHMSRWTGLPTHDCVQYANAFITANQHGALITWPVKGLTEVTCDYVWACLTPSCDAARGHVFLKLSQIYTISETWSLSSNNLRIQEGNGWFSLPSHYKQNAIWQFL